MSMVGVKYYYSSDYVPSPDADQATDAGKADVSQSLYSTPLSDPVSTIRLNGRRRAVHSIWWAGSDI